MHFLPKWVLGETSLRLRFPHRQRVCGSLWHRRRSMAERPPIDIAHLWKPGTVTKYKGVLLTTSGKFQPRLYSKEAGTPLPVGPSCDTAEEAARCVAAAMRDGPKLDKTRATRAPRGTVRSPACLPACSCLPASASHAHANCPFLLCAQASLDEDARQLVVQEREAAAAAAKAAKAEKAAQRVERKRARAEESAAGPVDMDRIPKDVAVVRAARMVRPVVKEGPLDRMFKRANA